MLEKLTRLRRMNALRQAAILSVIFMGITAIAGIALSEILRNSIEEEMHEELSETATYFLGALPRTSPDRLFNDLQKTFSEAYTVTGYRAADGKVYGDIAAGVFDNSGYTRIQQADLFSGDVLKEVEAAVLKEWDTEDRGHEGKGHDEYEEDLIGADEELNTLVTWFVYVVPAEGGRLAVAIPDFTVESFETLLPDMLLATGFTMSVLVLIGGAVFGFLAQMKFDRMRHGLERIAAGDLDHRIAPVRIRDDVDELAVTIDHTTKRVQTLVDQVGNLSVNIAHDLKTPLARLHVLLEEAETPGAARDDHIHAARTQLDQVISVFDTVMRIARIQSGLHKSTFTRIDLGELAATAAETFGAVVEDAGQTFQLDTSKAGKVLGDEPMLMQALGNLVQNSVRYAGTGAHVTLWARGQAIGISDTGPGIADKDLVRAVEPMVQLDASRSSDGVGLGLALVKAIAEIHKGSLELSNAKAPAPQGLTAGIYFNAR